MTIVTAAAPKPKPKPRGTPEVRRVGRFELRRVLGSGAQATVWLAHDPRLDREVAVKLLDPHGDALALRMWLQEARAVSRLTHPHIVPVFEADDGDGEPYLVFEYVPGLTLAERRRSQPAMPPREAVSLMLGILDALAAAHELGIVHRDLKPSNVLLGSDGRPRVMDFGIAARISTDTGTGTDTDTGTGTSAARDGSDAPERVVGTPGYMSPEAARGEAPLPGMDVFAAGVMLGELLAGEALMRETDPYRYLKRVQSEDLRLSDGVAVDATLRGVVQRAVARDPLLRYDSARAMHVALTAWLNPDLPPEAAVVDAGHGTIEFLLRRMRHKTDFPALSQSVLRIQRLASSETETLSGLSTEILKDVALTNKLLRMVNSAHFKHASGGGVSTISRAVALVGFAGIRNMALSLVLLEHMNDKAHAGHLKDEFLRALMAGSLASELVPVARDSEEAYLGSMFQNLGRLLGEYYFPEEALQIRQQLPAPTLGQASHAERETAACRVLGLGYDALGAGIARHWGLPDTLQRAMRPPDGEAPSRAVGAGIERLRWLGRGANAMTDALLSAADATAQQRALLLVAERYAGVLGLLPRDMLAAAQGARLKVADLAQAMGLQVASGALSRRLLDMNVVSRTGSASASPAVTPSSATADASTLVLPPGARAAQAAPTAAQADTPTLVMDPQGTVAALKPDSAAPASPAIRLASALDSVNRVLSQPRPRLNEVLMAALDGMQQALQFQRIVFCLRDSASGVLTGRVGLGEGATAACRAFQIPVRAAAGSELDLFATLCSRGADTLIADAGAGNVARRLPDWYRRHVNAPTFLLLPLMIKGAPAGLIYADKAQAGAIVLSDTDLALLRALRDQVIAAFKAGGAG